MLSDIFLQECILRTVGILIILAEKHPMYVYIFFYKKKQTDHGYFKKPWSTHLLIFFETNGIFTTVFTRTVVRQLLPRFFNNRGLAFTTAQLNTVTKPWCGSQNNRGAPP